MGHNEQYAWLSLLAWLGIAFYLFARFTTGTEILGQSIGFTLVEQPADSLVNTYIGLIVTAIIVESIVAAITALPAKFRGVEKDERDRIIASRANIAAYWYVVIALNVIVFHVIGTATNGQPLIGALQLTSPTGIIFSVLMVLAGAEVVNRAALVWNYRMS